MSAYRVQEFTRQEMAGSDPFGGEGTFLPAPGMSPGDILARVADCLGRDVHVVAWGDIGAWVAPGSSGMNAASFCDLWNGGRASVHG